MGKGSKVPEAPDPYDTASTQAQFDRLDTYGPGGGGVRYGYTDAQGRFVAGTPPKGSQSAVQTQESAFERAMRGLMEPAAQQLSGKLINQNVGGLPGAPKVQDTSGVASDLFNRSFSLMAPGIEQANSRLLNNLQARGIPIGGEAFNEAYGDQVTRTQDTMSRLAMDSNLAAGQEQSRRYNLDAANRGRALSELAALMGGGYSPPAGVPSGAVGSAGYGAAAGQAYQNELAQYQSDQQARMGMGSTLGSLGSALVKSSAALKHVTASVDPAAAARAVAELPVYLWRYRAEADPDQAEHVGPMAEHVHAVTGLGDGATISLIDMTGLLLAALGHALHRIEVLEQAAGGA